MLRNDYRRALIMLRSLRAGIAGYVRLERRTLIGTMQFTVTGARSTERLYALLLYQVNGLWYAQPIGQLGPARYGQSGLVYRFDPRSIEGRALEEYALVRLSHQRLADLPEGSVVGVENDPYGVRALVRRDMVPHDLPLEHTNLEDIILFLAKGGTQK